jgi:hypothetical protein
MHSRTTTAFLIAALGLTGMCGSVGRADSIVAETLRGIDRITVVIKIFPPTEFKDTGVTEQVLRPLIESELRKNGIKVVESSDLDAPILFVNLTGLTTSQSHAYNLSLAVRQSVTLASDSRVKADAATIWEQVSFGIVSSQSFADKIRSDTKLLVWTFIEDFYSVNPFYSASRK